MVALLVELPGQPGDGPVLVEGGHQVVHDVVTAGGGQEHVDSEDLARPGDRLGVDRVAHPVAGLGVAMAGRIGQDGEHLGRRRGDGAGDDVALLVGR
ncbi:hypothetical protein BA059_08815 [Mycolicibacterium sp. (ex Dasyatis americana)]|nr:hypothetical protein BA059_08815 [Mycolicibacterium sp. (ex Dasyatis americana)]OLT90184.1 hypothetical protein BKG60_24690 [Mycobacterium syngnathidarum]